MIGDTRLTNGTGTTAYTGLSPETAAAQFAALGSEQRLAVLRALVRAGTGGLTIGLLGERCGIAGSTLTHHLKILAAAGLVAQEKQGRATVCVGADYASVSRLADYLLEHCCADCTAPSKGHDHG
ncbi:ArsR/SmtB family transcription factor [Sagittula salina]|uniref:Helix-turn-helix transcriptional regulator n=1 Tax=Sagittula salina TaxID=2820268 RepID=A0A940MND4_9RHOB|nr:helix-turn-helix transcriptional regulator [Sagittula salina]MBP0482758.1 helix-turn-helix transcriptional regulator [Sagittula salina]